MRKYKIEIFFLIFLVFVNLSCFKEKSLFLNFVDMFQYMKIEIETTEIDFGSKDKSDEKFILSGWGSARVNKQNKKTYRWGIGNYSELVIYLTERKDKTINIECKPINTSSKEIQASKILINNKYLTSLEFPKQGNYSFLIPGKYLKYGSNSIMFRWKFARAPKKKKGNKDYEELAVRFDKLQILSNSKSVKNDEKNHNVLITDYNDSRMFVIPSGRIVEYYIDLPKNPLLQFKLFTDKEITDESVIHLSFYNQKGEEIVRHFKGRQLYLQSEKEIKLRRFGEETVKIVFSNPINNRNNFTVYWVDPVIRSSSKATVPKAWNINKHKVRTQKSIKEKPVIPHVFIYLIDTLRADHLSCYGYKRKTTPFIDEFAKDSIIFKKCFATASWTKPAVASVLTGLYPNIHGAEEREDSLPSEVDTIAEILKSNKYYTIFLTTNGNVTDDFNFIQGIDTYKFRNDNKNSSKVINAEFFRIINEYPEIINKPIFAYLHTIDPHAPYLVQEPFAEFTWEDKNRAKMAFKNSILFKKEHEGLNEEDINYIQSLYDCEILQNDHYFGEFIQFLKDKGLYENSMIILVADHGEQFDEHGFLFHGSTIYNEEIHVPLVIKFPHSKFSGIESNAIVTQVDIVPTILDYLSLESQNRTDGISHLSQINKSDIDRTIFIKEKIEIFNFVGFIDTARQTKQIVHYNDKSYSEIVSYEIFNIINDFYELHNEYLSKGD
ncbi:MAG: sulfatase [Candidatus Hodarchaeales archaeon]